MSNTLLNETKEPIKIGLTGGIGSGKSLVCSIFRVLNIPVFEADQEAKLIMDTDLGVIDQLTGVFGPGIYMPTGRLNRSKLAEIIFHNKELLARVNEIVHPAVRKKFSLWSSQQKAPYVLQEAAILFESGGYTLMDINILVLAPPELRIGRVMKRDRLTKEEITTRMKNQWPDNKKIALANFVIKNDGTEFLIPQILDIHNKIVTNGKIC
jgi:dephospho-CoA kinase